MVKTLLVKNIRWLVTCNDAADVLENVSMLVQNGVIVQIRALENVQDFRPQHISISIVF